MTLSQILMRTVSLTVIFFHLNVWSSDEDRVKLCHEDVAGEGVQCQACTPAAVSGPLWALLGEGPSLRLVPLIVSAPVGSES